MNMLVSSANKIEKQASDTEDKSLIYIRKSHYVCGNIYYWTIGFGDFL